MSTHVEKLKMLGLQIKKLRKSRKISQLNLSVKLGITREHLSKIERGVAYPSVKILFDIIDLLNADFKDIANF
jgi:hypothetical protein